MAIGVAEILCVIASLLIWLGLVVVIRGSDSLRARVLGGDGEFHWQSLHKEHVTQASRGLGLWGFAVLRLTFSVVVLGVVAWGVIAGSWMATLFMFSGMSFAGVGVYFLFAGVASLIEASGCCGRSGEEPGWGFRCIWVWYQVMLAIAIFIFFVVYIVLLPQAALIVGWAEMLKAAGDMFRDNPVGFWTALCQHQLNIVFMIVEAYFNRMTFVRAHVLFAVAYGNVYIVSSWFIFLYSGIFYYFFFDWRSYWTPLVYLILMVALYYAWRGCERVDAFCKRRVAPDLLPDAGRGERRVAEVRECETLALPIQAAEQSAVVP